MFPLLSVASARLRTSTETSHSRGRGFDSPRLHVSLLPFARIPVGRLTPSSSAMGVVLVDGGCCVSNSFCAESVLRFSPVAWSRRS